MEDLQMLSQGISTRGLAESKVTSDAMAEPHAVSALQEELTCPICLGLYRSPVSLACGHSFCKECIQEALRCCPHSLFSCPLCNTQAVPPTELQPNIQLRNVVQKFVDTCGQDSTHGEEEKHQVQREEMEESSGQQNEEVMCDFCLEKPLPAVKTCLSCETSLCQAHLDKHSTKASLKDHVLVEPSDVHVLAERRCRQHGKLLECYCVTDSVCVCALCCVASSHNSHKIISVEEAFGQAQNDFPKTLQSVKKYEAEVNRSLENLLKQETDVKTAESLRRNRLENLFDEMYKRLGSRKGELLETLSHGEEQQLSQIQAQIQTYKERKDETSHDLQELEALRDQKDPLLFTKGLTEIKARIRRPAPEKAAVQLPKPPIILGETTKEAILTLFQQFILDIDFSGESLPVHEHLTFAPSRTGIFNIGDYELTANSLMQQQMAMYGVRDLLPVHSIQSFSEGWHFWEVDTSCTRHWKLGITHQCFHCYLQMDGRNFRVFLDNTKITEKSATTAISTVRVELDCRRNTVSFYNISDTVLAKRCQLIQTVNVPASYPVHAAFSISSGSLRLL
uniref:E3 ubiquitin/ISG15 ligase TRIM25-like n=2 Tax=Anser brachyrhynchus TaxID=132585 RepID=A0A8B9BA54_9AVES